ncbi:MAG TPA: hypothetical protein VH878_09640, partial [Thermodesulfobacteriota bacterium]
VGQFQDNIRFHGFLRDILSHFITIDPPGSDYASATGINSSGQIVGWFNDYPYGFCFIHGFLRDKWGHFITIDDPDAYGCSVYEQGTFANGISDKGKIVGNFVDSGGVPHGFIAIP